MKLDSVKPPLPHNNAGLVLLVATRGCFPQIDLLGGATLCTSNTQLSQRDRRPTPAAPPPVCVFQANAKKVKVEIIFFNTRPVRLDLNQPGKEDLLPNPLLLTHHQPQCVCKQQADKKRLKDPFVSRSPSNICMRLCSCVSRSEMIV